MARILAGKGAEADLATIENLGELLKNCKCTLCMTSAVPVVDTIKHFREDYLAYIRGDRTPAPAANYVVKLTAPCQDKCPAHIDIPKYVEEIKDYRYEEALSTIRENMPLPSVCGRVCPHPCETACRRKNVDDSVNIMVLKRTASDYECVITSYSIHYTKLYDISLPEEVRARMRGKQGGEGVREGMAIARELVAAGRGKVGGYYLMPPFGKVELALELMDFIRRPAS